MSTETDATTEEEQNNTNQESLRAIDSREDIPKRDTLVQLRRNEGLTNEDIAKDHFPDIMPRDIGMFIQMYGIRKGWKDKEYLQSQIDSGWTVEQMASQWPVTESTIKTWMDRFDIEPNPVPELYDDAIEAIEALAENIDDDHIEETYEELANKLNEDEMRYFGH